jgi:hypothetical protein
VAAPSPDGNPPCGLPARHATTVVLAGDPVVVSAGGFGFYYAVAFVFDLNGVGVAFVVRRSAAGDDVVVEVHSMHVDDDLVIQADSARGTSFHVREMRAVVADLVPANSRFFCAGGNFVIGAWRGLSARVDDSRRTGCLYFNDGERGAPASGFGRAIWDCE